jgi:hypothetical protein
MDVHEVVPLTELVVETAEAGERRAVDCVELEHPAKAGDGGVGIGGREQLAAAMKERHAARRIVLQLGLAIVTRGNFRAISSASSFDSA